MQQRSAQRSPVPVTGVFAVMVSMLCWRCYYVAWQLRYHPPSLASSACRGEWQQRANYQAAYEGTPVSQQLVAGQCRPIRAGVILGCLAIA